MRRARVWAAGLLAGMAMGALGAASAAEPCDRACLKATLDAYLTAVIKRDPNAAPLAADYRATENAVAVKAGRGIWTTASSLGDVQRRYLDPVTGQAAYFGILKEGEAADVVSLRVKVENRKIVEAEWTIARKGASGLFDLAGLIADPPPPERTLAPAGRTPRGAMIAVADAYFQGLQDHDGSKVPHVSNCERVENGVRVTHRKREAAPATAAPPAGGAPSMAQEGMSGNCVWGFEAFRNSIAATTLRRFPVVDEEAGVVMGATIFTRPPGHPMRRNLLTEYFYIDDAKLAGVWAAMFYLDPAAPHTSGWDAK